MIRILREKAGGWRAWAMEQTSSSGPRSFIFRTEPPRAATQHNHSVRLFLLQRCGRPLLSPRRVDSQRSFC